MAEPDFLHTVRVAYDAVADGYPKRFHAELAAKPLDRAMLAVFAELVHLHMATGGHLLLAFQVGDERVHLTEWLGNALSLDAYWRPPDRIAELLSEAGLAVHAHLVREPDEGDERRQRAHLPARKPADISRS